MIKIDHNRQFFAYNWQANAFWTVFALASHSKNSSMRRMLHLETEGIECKNQECSDQLKLISKVSIIEILITKRYTSFASIMIIFITNPVIMCLGIQ